MEVIGDYARDGYALVRGLLPVEAANAFLRQLKGDVARSGGALENIRQGSDLLRREGVQVSGLQFLKLGALVMPAGLLAALLLLQVTT